MRIGLNGRCVAVAVLALSAAAQAADAPPAAAPAAARPAPVPAWGSVVAAPDSVRANCAAPGAMRGRSFYVDPAARDDRGDGSRARPWRTLAAVMASGRRFGAGDTILLLSGEHGVVRVTGRNRGFVTVRAAPGATPRLTSLRVEGASYWVFDRLTIANARDGFAAVVTIVPQRQQAVDNIVVTNSLITAADDTQGWSQPDWVARAPYWGIKSDSGTDASSVRCVAIAHNHITNILFAASIASGDTRFTDNVIDRFGGDGIDVTGSHVVIARNRITDNVDIGINNHNDAIQLQAGRFRSYRDVLIDGNTVIRQTRADTPFPTYLQGISAFNVDWFDVTVTNNVVITNAVHGISFASTHGGLIANNIVLNDEAGTPNFGQTWIKVGARTHEGFDSADIVVRNNIAWTIGTPTGDPTVRFTANIGSQIVWPVGSKQVVLRTPGMAPGDNRVIGNIKALFVDYEPRAFRFDLRPAKPGDTANWPDRLMAIVGGPSDGPQPGIEERGG